jgi:hypothetical protein
MIDFSEYEKPCDKNNLTCVWVHKTHKDYSFEIFCASCSRYRDVTKKPIMQLLDHILFEINKWGRSSTSGRLHEHFGLTEKEMQEMSTDLKRFLTKKFKDEETLSR